MTMQYEVAERIIGAPGAMNLLSIAAQFYGAPRIVSKIWSRGFLAAPQYRQRHRPHRYARSATGAGAFRRAILPRGQRPASA